MDPRKLFGNRSERQAADFLLRKGYKIVARQYKNRFGEIDLVARDGQEIVFVEVKARRSDAFGYPEESVTRKKLEKIAWVGELFLQDRRWSNVSYRIDVVAIEPSGEFTHLIGVGG